MKNISFALTTQQIRERTKRVTRRLGWKNVKPGRLLQGVVKGMGLKKGEHPEKLCVIRVTEVKREPLSSMMNYPAEECALEGFPELRPEEFVYMFCKHNDCLPWAEITRIAFDYE